MEAVAVTRRIPIAGPWITEREIAYVTDAVSTNWYEQANDYVRRFEDAFARHTIRRHAVSLPSCTSGLHLILAALGIGPGDEVIVPETTWIGTSAPISYVGATPVFADVDEVSWCIDVNRAADLINDRTKAIIAVDVYGGMPDYEALLSLAHKSGIVIIEDAAEAVGASYGGRPAGSFGVAAVFSFHGTKTLTTGEGGILVLDDDDLVDRVRFLRDHGRPPGDRDFVNREVAYKYKMSSLQAALGLAQLERLDEIVARKREVFHIYRELLGDLVTLNAEPEGSKSTFWMVSPIVPDDCPVRSSDIRERLDDHGIDSRPFFHPLSSLPAYAGNPSAMAACHRNAVSYALAPRGINLPSALSLRDEEIHHVSRTYRKIVTERR